MPEVITTDKCFRTGDLATIDANGVHRIVGREHRPDQEHQEQRVPERAGEVEQALLAHPAVGEAAVAGAPDPPISGSGSSRKQMAAVDLITNVAARLLSVHKRPRDVRIATAPAQCEMP